MYFFRASIVVASALAISFLSACGMEDDVQLHDDLQDTVNNQPIINGHLCDDDELPTAVAILVDAQINSDFGDFPLKTVICTGTLVAPDTVLAAAHCVDEEALLQSVFGLGEIGSLSFSVTRTADLVYLAEAMQNGTTPNFPADSIEVATWVKHEAFDLDGFEDVVSQPGPGLYNDIALLFLTSVIDGVEPEIIVTEKEASQLVEHAEVDIAGWGQQTVTSGPFEPPPQGSVGRKVCAQSFINEVGATEFQVGGDSTTSRKCHGDSGGPTFMSVETDGARKRRVVGITSHAYDESDCQKGGVDTKVSEFLEWIDANMTGACDNSLRAWCVVPGIIAPDGGAGSPSNHDDKKDSGKKDDDDGCSAQGGSSTVAAVWVLGMFGVFRHQRYRVRRQGDR